MLAEPAFNNLATMVVGGAAPRADAPVRSGWIEKPTRIGEMTILLCNLLDHFIAAERECRLARMAMSIRAGRHLSHGGGVVTMDSARRPSCSM